MGQETYAERKAAREARVLKRDPKAPGMAGKAWEVANAPLWEAPGRWGKEFSNWITTPESDDSWLGATTKGFIGGAAEGAGNLISGMSSPIGLGTMALGGVGGVAAKSAPTIARTATGAIKALGGLSVAHGAYRGGTALGNEELTPMQKMGEVGAGGLEVVGGILGARTPLAAGKPKATAGPHSTPAIPSSPSPMRQGPTVPAMLGDVEPVTTSTPFYPKGNQPPPTGTRMTTVEPTKTSAGIATGKPAKAMTPAEAAFEALVPNRYKTEMTAEGLTLNRPPLAEVEAPPTPVTGSQVSPGPKGPSQKELNEQAIAARRAKVGTAPAAAPVVATSTAPTMTVTAPAAKPAVTGPASRAEAIKAAAEKAKLKVAEPVPGQAGVTPVPEGVTVTKVAPGVSGKEPTPKVVPPPSGKKPKITKPPRVPAPKTNLQIAEEAAAELKSALEVKKWETLEAELRAKGLPDDQVKKLIALGKAEQITSAPATEVVKEAPKPAPPKAPPVPRIAPKNVPKSVKEAPKLEGIPEKRPSEARPLAYAKDETLANRVKQGDKLAEQEIAYRQAEEGAGFMDSLKASLAAAGKKVTGEETGAIGPGTGKLIREQAQAKAERAAKAGEVEGEIKTGFGGMGESAWRGLVRAATGKSFAKKVLPSGIDRSSLARLLEDETGAIGPGIGSRMQSRAQQKKQLGSLTGGKATAQKIFDVVNQARMTSMLSGLAVPKSILGNIGSHVTASIENQTIAPIKALGNLGAIADDLKTGWQTAENPALAGGLQKWNIPGRIMGAGDYAATKSLQRAGLSEAAAKEILLTSPNPVSGHPALNTNLGKLAVPFKTTPFNQFFQGLQRYQKYPAIWGGAVGLGAGAGTLTDDPEKLAMGAGFVGPYALPFTMGAMLTAGQRAGQGLSPIPEWSLQKSLTEPQAPFTESPGFRWLEPNLGFGSKAKPKAGPGKRPTGRKMPTRKGRD